MGVVRVAAAVSVGAVVLLALLWVLQRRMIYLPDQRVAPVDLALPGSREVVVRTADGLSLTTWYLQAGATAVLVLPGNAGDRADRAPLAQALADGGLSVMLLDYRGFGGNPGRPTEAGLLADARAARAALEARPEIDRVVLFGESLGSAVATAIARERAPDALILRSPFPTLADVGREHYPFLPVGLLLVDRYDTLGVIPCVSAPLLVVAGTADRIVPLRLSRALFEAAAQPKRLVEVAGAGHNDAALLTGPQMLSGIADFLREHGIHDPPRGDHAR